jgi:P-type conjugative transfer protein TrbG
MKRLLALILSVALVSVSAPAMTSSDELADRYFTGKNPDLTAQEHAALKTAKEAASALSVQPTAGSNGSVRFVYGAQQPSIICAVLQVCDVALQSGEQVNSIHLGDNVRWSVEPAITGFGPNEVQHLIIKPRAVGLETSLVVTTTRRTYHFKLRSHRSYYMPYVDFVYPEEEMAKWAALRKEARTREVEQREEKTIPQTGEYLGNLSFDYKIDGNTRWKPVRVYNDGRKTVIEMPHTMEQTEAPTLLVIRKEGGAFSDDETVLVNYRLQGARYIVDSVFDQAILIAGVGSDQDRVTITRTGRTPG